MKPKERGGSPTPRRYGEYAKGDGNFYFDSAVATRDDRWSDVMHGKEKLKSMEKVVFVAGGGLVTRLGVEGSQIWRAIQQAAEHNGGKIAFAGQEFTISQLKKMGKYYRDLQDKGYTLKCIDERLDHSHEHGSQVHVGCGMCQVVQDTINAINPQILSDVGITSVEDQLASELKQEKQRLLPGLEKGHISLSVNVVLGDTHYTVDESDQRVHRELPFNVTIPVDVLSQTNPADLTPLISNILMWNVNVAKAIIGGRHNEYSDKAQETMIIVQSSPDVKDKDLLERLHGAIRISNQNLHIVGLDTSTAHAA